MLVNIDFYDSENSGTGTSTSGVVNFKTLVNDSKIINGAREGSIEVDYLQVKKLVNDNGDGKIMWTTYI